MTAKEDLAAGYRLYEVDITTRVSVLWKPDNLDALGENVARILRADENGDSTYVARPLSSADEDTRGCLPHVPDSIAEFEPAIGEILDAMKDAK